MQTKIPNPQRQQGAFLVIAMILLIVLSALGVATMALAGTSERVSHNYSKYLAAQVKAISMAGYAERILDTYASGLYFGPGSCTTATTCNVLDNTFPMNGRPLLPWASGAGTTEVVGSSETDSWWNANGLAYASTFAGSGNARVVVAFLGSNPSSPYEYTYRVTGYATDPTGLVKSSFMYFHVWESYPPDPGDGTCGGAGCYYAQCCASGTTCGYDATSCSTSTATYLPPGWTCSDYFVSGLGYSGSVCTNVINPPS